MQFIAAVDPGVNNLGFAVFEKTSKKPNLRPVASGAYDVSKFGGATGRSPEASAAKVVGYLRDNLAPFGGDLVGVYCEKMQFYGSARGIASAGDVLEVAFCTGLVAAMAADFRAIFHPVPVQKWKGQLSKEQVITRVLKCWGHTRETFPDDVLAEKLSWPPSHDWDAVGIGLHVLGAL